MSDHMNMRARELGYTTYTAYLRGDHWKVFVASNLGTNCFCCRKDRNLQLHHITYERFGRELPQDVITLCGGCHRAVHELVSKGSNLINAHFIQCKRCSRGEVKRNDKWVNWMKLANRSNGQTVNDARRFLIKKGLADNTKSTVEPTAKAFRMKYVRLVDGRHRWSGQRFLDLVRADRKLKKLITNGGPIKASYYHRALEKPPNNVRRKQPKKRGPDHSAVADNIPAFSIWSGWSS